MTLSALYIAIFVFDFVTPLGKAIPLLYVVPIMVSGFLDAPVAYIAAAGAATALTIIGIFIGTPASTSEFAAFNRTMSIATFWTLAGLLALRHQAEERAREAARQFKALVEQSFVGIYALQDGVFKYVSPRFAEIFGYTPNELLRAASALDIIAEPQRDAARGHFARWATGNVADAVERMKGLKQDGTLIDIELHGAAMEMDGRPGVMGAVADVTDRTRTYEDLIRSRQELRELSDQLQRSQEHERERIAQDLHDELGQLLTAMKTRVTLVERRLTKLQIPAEAIGELRSVGSDISRASRTVHDIAWSLRPPLLSHFGLSAALQWLVEQFQERTGLAPSLAMELKDQPTGERATAIFRIVQESLTNIERHARARSVRIALVDDEHGLSLTIADDGVGFSPDRSVGVFSMGLVGMRERARALGGEFSIVSHPGEGTRVTVYMPRATGP